MIEYEPLKNLAILTVAAVASAWWVLKDATATRFAFSGGGRELARRTVLKLRGMKDYDGRHRAK